MFCKLCAACRSTSAPISTQWGWCSSAPSPAAIRCRVRPSSSSSPRRCAIRRPAPRSSSGCRARWRSWSASCSTRTPAAAPRRRRESPSVSTRSRRSTVCPGASTSPTPRPAALPADPARSRRRCRPCASTPTWRERRRRLAIGFRLTRAMEIHDDILGTLGNTPLVALRRYHPDGRAARRQARVLQPRRERQGPDRHRHDRGGRARGEAATRDDHRRADLRQHRPRARDRRDPARLQADLHRDHEDLEGEDRRCSRRTAPGSIICPVDVDRRRSALLLQGRRADPRRGGRLPPEPVPQRGESGDALRDDRPGDLAPDRRPASPTGWPASAPAARSRAWRATSRRRTRRSASIGVDPVGSVYAY